MHTMKNDSYDEHNQLRADVEEAMNKVGPIERFVMKIESKGQIKEEQTGISPQVQSFLDECDRLIKILSDDELYEKEKQKHKK